ncbi:MAG: ribosome maturation factor RimM [Polyangiaceae bacterium]
MAIDLDRWVPLAEVARPHGVRGEVRLRLYNEDSDLLLDAEEVLVRLKEGDEHEVSVDRARRADEAILMKLHSIDDRDRADEIRGAVLSMRRRDFPALEPGEFYHCDAEGASVLVRDDGGAERAWGTITAFRSYPTVEVMVIAREGGGVSEVPLLDQFVVEFDVEGGRIVLRDIEAFEERG